MLRWFGHVKRMDERWLTKDIYHENVNGRVGRGPPRRIYTGHDQINELLQKRQVPSSTFMLVEGPA